MLSVKKEILLLLILPLILLFLKLDTLKELIVLNARYYLIKKQLTTLLTFNFLKSNLQILRLKLFYFAILITQQVRFETYLKLKKLFLYVKKIMFSLFLTRYDQKLFFPRHNSILCLKLILKELL